MISTRADEDLVSFAFPPHLSLFTIPFLPLSCQPGFIINQWNILWNI